MKPAVLPLACILSIVFSLCAAAQGVNINTNGTTTPTTLFSVGNSEQLKVDGNGDLIKINNVTYGWPSSAPAVGNFLMFNTTSGGLTWTTTTSQTIYANGFDAGTGKFAVNSSGNITKINNVTTSFPASQGSANSYLVNDGSGNLSWATTTAGSGITAEGGFASNFYNGTGSTIARGSVVRIDTSSSVTNGVTLQTTTVDYMPIGVAAADIPSGTSGPVTVAGIADVLVDASGSVTRKSMMIFPSITVDGKVQATDIPANNTNHWGEIGHNLTKPSGTPLMMKVVLHFN
jgi:hypothetical protein